jgi:hypothetical protein
VGENGKRNLGGAETSLELPKAPRGTPGDRESGLFRRAAPLPGGAHRGGVGPILVSAGVILPPAGRSFEEISQALAPVSDAAREVSRSATWVSVTETAVETVRPGKFSPRRS